MKVKNVLLVVSIIIGVVTMAAGVAVLVDHLLKKKECCDGYIEYDCDVDEVAEQ